MSGMKMGGDQEVEVEVDEAANEVVIDEEEEDFDVEEELVVRTLLLVMVAVGW